MPVISPIFFFNASAATDIYTLSLHDALPIWFTSPRPMKYAHRRFTNARLKYRSEEHTSELQSRGHLVCRLLLEKKNGRCNTSITHAYSIVICIQPITLHPTGGCFVTASIHYR